MTESEKQQIINEVLDSLKVNSLTIEQLVEVASFSSDDCVELTGGRRISLAMLKELFNKELTETVGKKLAISDLASGRGESTTTAMTQAAVTQELVAQEEKLTELSSKMQNLNLNIGETFNGEVELTSSEFNNIQHTSDGNFLASNSNFNSWIVELVDDGVYQLPSNCLSLKLFKTRPEVGKTDTDYKSIAKSDPYAEYTSNEGYKFLLVTMNISNNGSTYTYKAKYSTGLGPRVENLEKKFDNIDTDLNNKISESVKQTIGGDFDGEIELTSSEFNNIQHTGSEFVASTSKFNSWIVELVDDGVYQLPSNCLSLKLFKTRPEVGKTDTDYKSIAKSDPYAEYTSNEGYKFLLVTMNISNNGSTYTYKAKYSYGLKKEIILLQNELLTVKKLGNKIIVCFGDSITEFRNAVDKFRYSDWISELSGATTYNIGKGGARLAQRMEQSLSPQNQQEALAAFDIVNMIVSWSDKDYSYIEASINSNQLGVYQDKCEEIFAVMQSINIDDVDIVTVFGGTNDYTGGTEIGEETYENKDKNTLYGAINVMVESILTANPLIKIYAFTPIIRMFESSVSQETSSDVYVHPSASGKTLPQYGDVIYNAFKINHIPTNNWYWTLGFNTYNFREYFKTSTDGIDYTHPYNGFKYLAQKMVSYIESNL